jgi:hypothetical protein
MRRPVHYDNINAVAVSIDRTSKCAELTESRNAIPPRMGQQ